MANPKRTVLGVEIGAREVRMVEMRGGTTQPQILRAGKVPLPPGAMDGDRIVQIEVVADLIRGLHSRIGCQARAVIVAMGIQSVVSRVFAIPRVPDSELRTVVEGELAHFQILRSGAGAFDFFRIDSATSGADSMPSVLLMAVEERVAQGYRITIEKAGLQLLALEPVTLSLFRAAFSRLETEPAALCLAVTPQRSELSILDHTQLRIYRRLDIGSNDFIVGRKSNAGLAGTGTTNLSGDTGPLGETSQTKTLLNKEDVPTAELSPTTLAAGATLGDTGPLSSTDAANYGEIIPQAAASLANEIQRSLDYYRREYPNATAIGRIILTTNDPDAEGLSEWLAQALRMDVRVAEIPTNPGLPPQTIKQLETPQGLSLLGACGAALHALTPDWKQVPRFNLSVGIQSERPGTIERDRLMAVSIFSACILIGGISFAVFFNQKTEQENYKTKQFQQTLGQRTSLRDDMIRAIEEERRLASIVKADGLPIPGLMDVVSRSLPNNANLGLSTIQFSRDGKIALDGKARDSAAYTSFVFELLRCHDTLTPPSMGNYTVDPQTNIITFRLDSAYRGTQAAQSLSGSSFASR